MTTPAATTQTEKWRSGGGIAGRRKWERSPRRKRGRLAVGCKHVCHVMGSVFFLLRYRRVFFSDSLPLWKSRHASGPGGKFLHSVVVVPGYRRVFFPVLSLSLG